MIHSRDNYKEIVKLLLEARADVNIKDKYGEAALIYTLKYGYTEIVELLIEAGANVNIKDKDGLTALIYALKNGNLDIAKLLIEKGADINFKNKKGKNSLDYIIKKLWDKEYEERDKCIEIAYAIIREMKKQLINMSYNSIEIINKNYNIVKEVKNISVNEYIEESIQFFDFLLSMPKDMFINIIKFIK